jgi:VanZ family protein
MLGVIKVESTPAWSGAHTAQLLWRLTEWLGIPLHGPELHLVNLILRKCGHMIGYGVLCLSWYLLLRATYWYRHEYQRTLKSTIAVSRMWWRIEWAAIAVFCTFLVATADETHQMSLPGRTGRWHDVGLDVFAAILVMLLVRARARRRCRGTPNG